MPTIPCSSCSTRVPVREGTDKVTCGKCTARALNPPASTSEPSSKRIPDRLTTAVKSECCNYFGNMHQATRDCDVLAGKPCSFFEQAVIPGIRKRYEGIAGLYGQAVGKE